jgi:hypothetical protein
LATILLARDEATRNESWIARRAIRKRGLDMNRLSMCTLAGWLALGTGLVPGDAGAEDRGTSAPHTAIAPEPGGLVPARQNPTANVAERAVWKRVTLGSHKGVNALRAALEAARMRLGDSADEILGRPAFPYSRIQTDLDLVMLTPGDLGFTGSAPIADVYRRATQLGLELCPAEAGPLLRLAYPDQPVGEFLRVAMEPIATWEGEPIDLTIANGGAGLLLIGGESRPDVMLHASVKLVFVRPQRIALPDAR